MFCRKLFKVILETSQAREALQEILGQLTVQSIGLSCLFALLYLLFYRLLYLLFSLVILFYFSKLVFYCMRNLLLSKLRKSLLFPDVVAAGSRTTTEPQPIQQQAQTMVPRQLKINNELQCQPNAYPVKRILFNVSCEAQPLTMSCAAWPTSNHHQQTIQSKTTDPLIDRRQRQQKHLMISSYDNDMQIPFNSDGHFSTARNVVNDLFISMIHTCYCHFWLDANSRTVYGLPES